MMLASGSFGAELAEHNRLHFGSQLRSTHEPQGLRAYTARGPASTLSLCHVEAQTASALRPLPWVAVPGVGAVEAAMRQKE
ncbi:hypothetical protein FOA52_012261 [Chlamydomonas sp. UWO 241]|nr:hypothetical protein FOA52_012261 [Chlamydomonas sp. UWO 241]